MKKLYETNELNFALVWIGIYCLLQSLANPLSERIGIAYLANAIFSILQSLILLTFIRKNNLQKQYGLCKSQIPAKYFLYYIPLFILATTNFWNGIAYNANLAETICFIICMLHVGFLEEIIFRGFLFQAMAKDNVKTAIIISSVTFGLGHVINLINGSDIFANLLQITGAMAIGFLFVILYERSKSLLPCIMTHAAINITSIFSNEVGLTLEKQIIFQLLLFAISISYAYFLIKSMPRKVA